MTYSFSTTPGAGRSETIPTTGDLTGYTLTAEFSIDSSFSSVTTKAVTGSGKNVPLVLTASEVDSLKDTYYRIKAVKDGKTTYVQSGVVDYVTPGESGPLTVDDVKDIVADPYALAVGESTFDRRLATSGQPMSAGRIDFVYFQARKDETINNLRMFCNATAAAPTPTLCRLGVYAVAANGDLTLLAAIANDTTLFSTTFTAYTRALTTPLTKGAGRWYAVASLVVSAAATPHLATMGVPASASYVNVILGAAPRLAGETVASSYTDLPASLAAAEVNNGRRAAYVELRP